MSDNTLDALGRVSEFTRQWSEQVRKFKGGKTDLIYSVHFDIDAEAVDLLNSDLSALVAEVRRSRDIIQMQEHAEAERDAMRLGYEA